MDWLEHGNAQEKRRIRQLEAVKGKASAEYDLIRRRLRRRMTRAAAKDERKGYHER